MVESEAYWHFQVHKVMPDLEIKTIKLHQEGLVNDVVIVNNQWVMRFAKSEWGQEQLRLEGYLMRTLGSLLSLPMPSPDIIHDDVIVYPLIHGKAFQRRIWHEANETKKIFFGNQLGQFLQQLHSVNQDALDFEIPPTLAPVTVETWQEIYEKVIEKVFPHLLPHQVEWATSLFAPALKTQNFFDFDPVLVHGDFAPYHILYSPEEKKLCGVIDFGVAGMGDPATDLGSLINYYGENLVVKIKDAYPAFEKLLPRARFYARAIELQWVLLGVESGEYYWFTAHIGGARDIGFS